MPLTPKPLQIEHRWRRMSLLGQFALMGTLVLLLGMATIGYWVNEQIKEGVMRNSAASTALFMSSFIEPVVQELNRAERLSTTTAQLLDQLLSGTDLSERVVSFKIWKNGGLIAYSSRHEIIGMRFPTTQNLQRAWLGEVTAEFDSLEDEEDALERQSGVPLLEIYSPIRDQRSGRIIAVAEFYERARALRDNLDRSTRTSWMVVGGITLLMFSALTGIVMRGNRTIARQRQALETQVRELSELLHQNRELSERVQRASLRTTELNERYLRRISADLHDGPAQLMAFALLRIDSLSRQLPANAAEEATTLKRSLNDALNDIRAICTGLSLPELAQLSPQALLQRCVDSHARSTNSQVGVDWGTLPETLSHPLKICVYRFVQEGLSNAWRHAAGQGQRVSAHLHDQQLTICVADTGAGFDPDKPVAEGHGLGLAGLRERAEALGGVLRIDSSPRLGTTLTLTLPIQTEKDNA